MADSSQQGTHNDDRSAATGVKISLIMPVYNATEYIVQSLPPLIGMMRNNEILEVIVVDDSSSDETPRVARDLGATVIPSGGRLGPGAARNRAAEQAGGDILWFVDADVIVEDGAVDKLALAFSDPGVSAVFGSYNDRPAARNFLSQYKNLVHHYYHNRTPTEASTFWSGCGAIRKRSFLDLGGFDVDLFNRPSVEDIELGYRLRDKGERILLVPELLSTHLKEWRLLNLLHTDIFCRALPWSRLMLTREGLHNDLNVTNAERVRAGLSGLLLIALVLALPGWVPWWVPGGVALLLAFANRDLFTFFQKRKGPVFALAGTLFHQVYYLYSSAAFAWCWIEVRLLRLHRRRSSDQD